VAFDVPDEVPLAEVGSVIELTDFDALLE